MSQITLLDVGAADGLDARWSRIANILTPVVVEPDSRAVKTLETKMKESYSSFQIIQAALGNGKKQKLHLCKWQQASSLLEPNNSYLKRFPNVQRFRVEESVEIETRKLDDVFSKDEYPKPDFVKLDTQGSEFEILQSGEKLLGTVIGIETEVEFQQIYKDQPCFEDVVALVKPQGFELYDLKRCHWKRDRRVKQSKGQLVFGDALFFRPPESDLLINPKNALKAAILYALYGYMDNVAVILNNQLKGVDIESGLSKLLRVETGTAGLTRIASPIQILEAKIFNLLDRRRTFDWDRKLGA